MNPIVGIGEVLWDVYPDRKVAGGAPFNFAFHCHQLGHPSVIVSRVGDDDLGRELRDRVRALGLSDEYIQTDHDHPTGTVQVTLGAEGVPTYTITENVAWDFLRCPVKLNQLGRDVPAACFGTLAQRTLAGRAGVLEFVNHVRRGVRVFDVNLRGTANPVIIRDSLPHADWIKVNEDESRIFTDLFGQDSSELMVDENWYRQTAERAWIVTRGAGGAEVLTSDGRFHIPGVPANVVDTVGAGDAFTAAMVCLHLEGKSLREAAKFAVHYAARVCEQPGGTPAIDRAEVERAAGLKS